MYDGIVLIKKLWKKSATPHVYLFSLIITGNLKTNIYTGGAAGNSYIVNNIYRTVTDARGPTPMNFSFSLIPRKSSFHLNPLRIKIKATFSLFQYIYIYWIIYIYIIYLYSNSYGVNLFDLIILVWFIIFFPRISPHGSLKIPCAMIYLKLSITG